MGPKEIRAIREALGYTQVEFAKELGCSPRAIQKWEQEEGTNARTPRGATLTLLKRYEQLAKEKEKRKEQL